MLQVKYLYEWVCVGDIYITGHTSVSAVTSDRIIDVYPDDNLAMDSQNVIYIYDNRCQAATSSLINAASHANVLSQGLIPANVILPTKASTQLIMSFPNEIWYHIFRFLPYFATANNIMLTNRHLCNIGRDYFIPAMCQAICNKIILSETYLCSGCYFLAAKPVCKLCIDKVTPEPLKLLRRELLSGRQYSSVFLIERYAMFTDSPPYVLFEAITDTQNQYYNDNLIYVIEKLLSARLFRYHLIIRLLYHACTAGNTKVALLLHTWLCREKIAAHDLQKIHYNSCKMLIRASSTNDKDEFIQFISIPCIKHTQEEYNNLFELAVVYGRENVLILFEKDISQECLESIFNKLKKERNIWMIETLCLMITLDQHAFNMWFMWAIKWRYRGMMTILIQRYPQFITKKLRSRALESIRGRSSYCKSYYSKVVTSAIERTLINIQVTG